jgi:hypothetical protein
MKAQVVILGRKRKIGARKPSGDLITPDRDVDVKAVAQAMPHRRGVVVELRHDPKAESALGRYHLSGKITEWEYEAGTWYAVTVSRYRAVISAPNPSPRSNAGVLVPIFGGQPWAVDDDEAERRKSAYNQAFGVLDSVGQRAAKAVARVCVYNENCPLGLWGMMRMGLLKLAVHRGLCTEKQTLDIWRYLCKVGNA